MARSNRPAPEPYEVEDAAHTVQRAHAIHKDKHMMRHVKKHVKKKASDLAALAQALGAGGGGAQPTPPPAQSLGQAFGP